MGLTEAAKRAMAACAFSPGERNRTAFLKRRNPLPGCCPRFRNRAVTFPSFPRFPVGITIAAGLMMLMGSCLTPPGVVAQRNKAAAMAEQRPRQFVHSSSEILKAAALGWNLGNSLDASGGESGWGNPPATLELMKGVAKAGFGLVRIPITWTPHMGSGPDFVIEPSWLARVAEVVDYARAAGLYAVINIHHDGADGTKGVQWIALKDEEGNITEANNAAVKARFIAVWTQIAKHFAGYGEELLFESMNEIHDGYGPPNPRYFPIINDLNQEFVKLVRASGGNNPKRHLVVPGYNTHIDHTIAGFKLPTDTIPDRLILSVHFYDPYLFTLMGQTHTWGEASPGRDNWGQEDFVVKQFDKLKTTFIDKGIPVLLGEYGATNQEGFEDYRRYYMEYVTKVAGERGILPVYWDNGGRNSGGDSFAMLDRNSGDVLHPALLAAMRRAATSTYTLAQIPLPKPSK
jgi:endoglucanase